jgi:hypothetical protein
MRGAAMIAGRGGRASRRSLPPMWRLFALWSLPLPLLGAGAIGYHAIEHWPWFEALYVAVHTLTSLGGSGSAFGSF